MKKNPKVSICIPTFNRMQYLAQTVQSALDQDYKNIEVLVSDNFSSDNTEELMKQFSSDPRVIYNRNSSNIGMVLNWRKLLYEMASGDWFILLSDDDYFIDNAYISKAVKLLELNTDMNVVYASGYINNASGDVMREMRIPYDEVESGKNIFLKKYTVVPQEFTLCNIIFNVEKSKNFKAFSNLNNLYCDSQLFSEMCLSGKVGVIKDYVSVYRYHSGNLVTKKRTFEELIAICEVYFSPYRIASASSVITSIELAKWDVKYLRPAIKSVILHISADHADRFEVGYKRIKELAPYNLNVYFADPKFFLKYIITKNKFLFSLMLKLKNKFGGSEK